MFTRCYIAAQFMADEHPTKTWLLYSSTPQNTPTKTIYTIK